MLLSLVMMLVSQVREFKYKWKIDELSNFTLKTGFLAMMIMASLAMIGCDTLPGGVYGLGAKGLHVLIDEQKPIDATALVDIVIAAKKCRATEDKLHAVIDTLMHESFNTIECSTQEEAAEGSNYQDVTEPSS